MRNICLFLCGFLTSICLFWYGGVDFDERDALNAYFLFLSLFIGGICTVLFSEDK